MMKQSEILLAGKKSIILTCVIAGLILSGCSQKTPEIDTSTVVDTGYTDTNAVTNDNQIDQMSSMENQITFGSDEERISAVQNEVQVLYFATDSYKLSDSEMTKLVQNSTIFNGDLASDLSIKIEGNCDEWGTDEYNYALGLKRAKSVKDSLEQSGVNEGRMALISYGESKPICSEHNDGCWQQNRRVDFKLLP
ncbi:MAG: OmpA family protein [Epsilonproteobacteria bacterium]|nr:OmpA family protein [Campylobacterota bacterium]